MCVGRFKCSVLGKHHVSFPLGPLPPELASILWSPLLLGSVFQVDAVLWPLLGDRMDGDHTAYEAAMQDQNELPATRLTELAPGRSGVSTLGPKHGAGKVSVLLSDQMDTFPQRRLSDTKDSTHTHR